MLFVVLHRCHFILPCCRSSLPSSQRDLENALAQVEDETDAQATVTARKEEQDELAEFVDEDGAGGGGTSTSTARAPDAPGAFNTPATVDNVLQFLTPVQRLNSRNCYVPAMACANFSLVQDVSELSRGELLLPDTCGTPSRVNLDRAVPVVGTRSK